MSDIKFKASVDAKKGEASLQELDKGVGKLEKSTPKAAAGFKALAMGVAAGVAVFATASKALRGLIKWMGDAVEKAAIQQAAEMEMRAALESTGREVEANAEHFKKYASKIQEATVFGDEQILSAQALMIQLTKLNREGLDAATKGAIGLASVYKTDLQAATTLVGKALAGNYGALSRYGIMVERTATDEEKRASILEQLQIMYQRAEAETDTYQGSVKQLSNTYGDLKEQAGDAIIKNEELLGLIKLGTQAIRDFIDAGYPEHLAEMASQIAKNAQYFIPFAESLALIAAKLHLDATRARALREEQEKLAEIAKDYLEKLNLLGTGLEETTEIIESQIPKIQGISIGMDFWGRKVLKLNEIYEGLQDTLSNVDQWLPDPRDMTGVLEQAQSSLESYEGAFKTTFQEMTESQKSFSATAIGQFLMMEASVKGFVGAIMNTLEQWAIGQLIPTIMAALPFPANLLAVGGAVLFIKSLFAGIRGEMEEEPKGKAGGGWVGLHGEEIVKVGERGPEYITKTSDIRNVFNQTGGAITINLIVKDQIDPYTAQRITREQIIPQILESLDINEYKKQWQERLR